MVRPDDEFYMTVSVLACEGGRTLHKDDHLLVMEVATPAAEVVRVLLNQRFYEVWVSTGVLDMFGKPVHDVARTRFERILDD